MAWLGFKQNSSLGQLLENPNMQHPADLVSHSWPHEKGRKFMTTGVWVPSPRRCSRVPQPSPGFSGDIWGIPLEMSNQNPFGNMYSRYSMVLSLIFLILGALQLRRAKIRSMEIRNITAGP